MDENEKLVYINALDHILNQLKYGAFHGGLSANECYYVIMAVHKMIGGAGLCGTSQPTVQDATQ